MNVFYFIGKYGSTEGVQTIRVIPTFWKDHYGHTLEDDFKSDKTGEREAL